MQAMIHMCRSEDSSVEAILLLHVVLGIKCQVLGLHSNKSFTWPKYFHCDVTTEKHSPSRGGFSTPGISHLFSSQSPRRSLLFP